MKRVLVFDGDKGPKRFEMCRTAILSAGNGKGERIRETLRREARLLDALDAVSEAAGDENLPSGRRLHGSGTVSLAQDDFALLERYLDETPWVPHAARAAVDVQDWLSAAEKIDG